MPRLDELTVSGFGLAAERLGHRELWDSGLGKLVRVAVKAAAVPTEEVTFEQLRDRMGITTDHVDVLDGLVGIARRLRR